MKNEYTFDVMTTGFYTVTVKANSLEEAKQKAIDAWYKADFGELENLDCEIGAAY